MSGRPETPWTPQARARWQRIRDHAFEEPRAPIDFVARLVREYGWTREQALAAIEEYRRFCFLTTVSDEIRVPSEAVDEVWHLHLTYSEDYWQRFCPEALGVALHHRPGGLARGDAERNRLGYARTMAEYERWFGPPPESWWPGTQERFAHPGRFRCVDRTRFWLIPKPRWPAAVRAIAIAAIGLVVTSLAQAMSFNPLDWKGPAFLVFFAIAATVSLVIALVWRRSARNIDRGLSWPDLDPSAMAMLAGGEARVIDRVIGDLLTRGMARFHPRKRRLKRTVSELPHDLDDTARAIAEALARDGNVETIETRSRAALDRLRGVLVQRGLLLDQARAARIAWQSAIGPGLVLMLGLTKIVIGIIRDRPVALLVLLCVGLAVATLSLALKRPLRTTAGDRVLRDLKHRHARAVRAPLPEEWPIALALVGSSVLSGTAHASYFAYRHPLTSGGGVPAYGCITASDGSGSGSSGCGGCGGSGN